MSSMKYEYITSRNKEKVMINVKVFGRQWAQELDLFFKKSRTKDTHVTYTLLFSLFMRIFMK